MNTTKRHSQRDPRDRWATSVRAILRDAWVFFTLVILLIAVFFILWPLQFVDRLVGTRMVARLIGVVERVGDL